MIKCYADTARHQERIKGTVGQLAHEAAQIIGGIYLIMYKKSPEAAAQFRKSFLAAVTGRDCPVWAAPMQEEEE